MIDGWSFAGGGEGGTEVDGGVGEGRCFEINGGFRMSSVGIGSSTTGVESTHSLVSTESRRSTIS